MQRNDRYKMHTVLLLLTLLLYGMPGRAAFSDRFTEKTPLIIACDWDLPPYEFFDDEGNPSGYSIELMTIILEDLEIPHKFVMKENNEAGRLFREHHADLYIAPALLFEEEGCYSSSNVLHYYKTKVVSRADAPPLHMLSDISPDKVVVRRKNSQMSAHQLRGMEHLKTEYHAPMEALSGVSSGKYDYFIWGEEPLKWKIRELNLENLRINDLHIPVAELRIGCYDKELLDAIDDQYARLEQKGEVNDLRDKWFHPERRHDNASPILIYVAITALLLLLILFLLNRLIMRNVKRMTQKSSEQTRLMNLALDMGGYMVSEYNPKHDVFKNLRGELVTEGTTMEKAVSRIHQDDVEAFEKRVQELINDEEDTVTPSILVRRKRYVGGHIRWQYLTGNGIKERDEQNHTAYLLVGKDITKDVEDEQRNNELAAKYLKAFETSLVAMTFYSPDGYLLDLNDQMKQIIGVSEKNLEYFHQTRLFDAPLFAGVLHEGMTETVHACQHMVYPELGLDKYLEYRVRPVFNDANEIRYYAVTVRDVTGERHLYREQQAIEHQLKVVTDEVGEFERQMNYLLKNSDMYIWRTDFASHTVEVARSLHETMTSFTFEEYLQSLSPEESESARITFYNPLARSRSISHIRHFTCSPLTKRDAWYAVSGVPMFDKNNLSKGHFGLIRDITKFMKSQEELRRETVRAEHSGAQKVTFLANMTHEIRTPLNAIVGFSDLLHVAESSEERTEFIRIIRQNCDLLLRLVDDILETSDMNKKPQKIAPTDIDFAVFFDEVCQTAAQRVQEPAVSFIKDNPFTSLPARIDKERIQQVITNFVTNAVKYTHEGHIKVGCREEKKVSNGVADTEGLYIYCEDTGAGIPKEKQASVFDRFVKLNDYVQGTGLGLSICKSIAELCGGYIGVMSEGEGKGSTFWIWIPRYLTSGNL